MMRLLKKHIPLIKFTNRKAPIQHQQQFSLNNAKPPSTPNNNKNVLYYDSLQELPARFQRAALSQSEMDAIEV